MERIRKKTKEEKKMEVVLIMLFSCWWGVVVTGHSSEARNIVIVYSFCYNHGFLLSSADNDAITNPHDSPALLHHYSWQETKKALTGHWACMERFFWLSCASKNISVACELEDRPTDLLSNAETPPRSQNFDNVFIKTVRLISHSLKSYSWPYLMWVNNHKLP